MNLLACYERESMHLSVTSTCDEVEGQMRAENEKERRDEDSIGEKRRALESRIEDRRVAIGRRTLRPGADRPCSMVARRATHTASESTI